MNVLIVIPARLQSTRLPEKPLKDIHGMSLIERVYRQAKKISFTPKVIIATDAQKIYDHTVGFGGETMMTPETLATGSDRVAYVAAKLAESGEQFDIVANVQGDMPFINPVVIEKCVRALAEDSDFDMATIATPITSHEDFHREACVKVAIGERERALYFSRSPIPFWRDAPAVPPANTVLGHKHMGLYVFRPEALLQITSLPQSQIEMREKLEQLRALANGFTIRVAIVSPEEVWPSIEVDTEADLQKAREAAVSFDRL